MRRAWAFCLAALALGAQDVTYDRLVNALKEQQNWLTYWGDYSAGRHRDLNQINTGNVKNLRVDWIFQTGLAGFLQTVPLAADDDNGLARRKGSATAPL